MKWNFAKLHEMMKDKRLKPTEKALLINLLLYAGTDGLSFPSQKTLASDFGYSARQISNCLLVLLAHGWLKDWKRRGYGRSNRYFFNQELYFNNDESNRNSSSTQLSTPLPNQTGTTPPSNVTQLNKSTNVINKRYSSIQDIKDNDIEEISEQYKVPIGLVQLQLEALRNYCSSKGRTYKDYKAALKNFVIKEAKSTIERRAFYGNKRGIDARDL